jgi:alpha-L-rhamnosidase
VLEIAPQVTSALEWVEATYESPLGRIGCAWRRTEAGDVSITVEVPVGAIARVRVPGSNDVVEVGSGHHAFSTKAEELG